MRYSKQRQVVRDILKSRCDHPTADMIFAAARETEPNISLGTVYRNLKVLSDEGEILTLETEDKKIHYDGDTRPHSHFLCSVCGGITDIFEEPQIPKILSKNRFFVCDAKCVYYGNCNKCSQITAKADKKGE